jgi:hypothetical protein
MGSTPTELVVEYYRARNCGDLDRAAALRGLEPGQTREEIRAGLERLHAVWEGLRFDIEQTSERDGVVDVRFAMQGRLRGRDP